MPPGEAWSLLEPGCGEGEDQGQDGGRATRAGVQAPSEVPFDFSDFVVRSLPAAFWATASVCTWLRVHLTVTLRST